MFPEIFEVELMNIFEHDTIRGQAPDSQGEERFRKFQRGGNIFLKIFWRGIDFLPSKGGYPLQLFTKIPEFLQKYFF